jgi:hypothetical protein
MIHHFSLDDYTLHSALHLSVNQAQGQFLEDAGVDLQTNYFLYRLLNIAGSVEQLCISARYRTFQNCVYNFVFGRNVKRLFRRTCISASVDITLITPNVGDE